MNNLNRRSFLASTFATAAVSGLASAASGEDQNRRHKFCYFSKPFNSLSFDELAEKSAALGFDGVEAPIRKGGNIEPEQVPDKLPKLVEALAKRGKEITVMTSDINDPNSPLTESVLTTAAQLGIKYYRMKYFRYDESRSITQQIDEWQRRLIDLAAMNEQLGITAVYQNHAGRGYFGAPVWDLAQALDGIDPKHVGAAYDIRHATVEAGMSWPIGFQRIRPHIQAVYVKDFIWGQSRPNNVPLGKGRVDPKFFDMLAATEFTGPISLHEEYLDHRRPELVPQHWAAIENDFDMLKSWVAGDNTK